jgi:hypothetical protein
MHLEAFVEEPSAEAALESLLPCILPGWSHRIHPYQGKASLLKRLPNRLKGLSKWLPDELRVLVLVDRDDDDCCELKQRLEKWAEEAGLATKSSPQGDKFQVLNRIAVEELEAWFLGDTEALLAAYPKVPATFPQRRGLRKPDAVGGGTWEALEKLLKAAGYYPTGMPKTEVARAISKHMQLGSNRSHSFQVFVSGLRAFAEQA